MWNTQHTSHGLSIYPVKKKMEGKSKYHGGFIYFPEVCLNHMQSYFHICAQLIYIHKVFPSFLFSGF